MRLQKIFIHLSFILLLAASITFAGGSDLFLEAGGRSISLNGLYFAGANGVQSSISNPAGLTYLSGYGAEIFLIDRIGQQEFNSQTQGEFLSFRQDNINYGGGVFGNISGNIILAISYDPVLGYNVNWPFALLRKNGNTTNVLTFDMFNQITINSITPSAAIKFGNISLGLSANIYRIEHKLSFPISNEKWYSGVGVASYQLSYDQKGWAYGFTAGAIANLTGNLKLGISLRSGYNSTLKGTAASQIFSVVDSTSNTSGISAYFKMPWNFGAGIIYTLNENLNLNVDAAYSLWSNVEKNLLISSDNPVWQNRLSRADSVTGIRGNVFPLNFRNTIDLGLGIEYTPVNGMIYRAGYRFSESPNKNASYSMFFPAVNQHWFSVGLGYREEKLSIDAALAYTLGISNNVVKSGEPYASGKYTSNAFIPSLTLLYNF